MASENKREGYVVPVAREFHHNIFEIRREEDFEDLLQDLNTAGPQDVIYLHINSPGGRLDLSCQIITAIRNCQATVIGSAEGEVYSGGSLIFFACHGFVISDLADFMLHDAAGGQYGKVNDNLSAAQASKDYLRRVYYSVYSGFFSDEEIESVLNGKDIWLAPEEVELRIKKVVEKNEDENED